MKKLFTLLVFLGMCSMAMLADVTIDGKTYAVDTIIHRQVGPSMMHSVLRLPDYPLNVYIMEMDVTDPNNRIESSFEGRVGRLQAIEDAMVLKRTATKRPIAMCNANFWVTTNSATMARYQLRHPLGGLVRNDTIVVNPTDDWDGGPGNTGTALIDHDGHVYMGTVGWSSTISSSKVLNGAPQVISNINRRAIRGEMALFNECYAGGRQMEDDWISYDEQGVNATDNYYLKFVEGEDWAMGQDMHFVVSKILLGTDRATYNNHYQAILTCTGETKELMSPLVVGDTVSINMSWSYRDAQNRIVIPKVENLVEGNATVMYRGELTERNFNEAYNSQVYSRTAYGTNVEGNKVYLIVIDKSLSPLYGRSIGASTSQMCQILKSVCPDVTDVVNMDAGGSALMYVDGDYANTSTENSARSVACGWMMEAVGEEDSIVASIGFADYHVKMPIYSTYKPVIWGYNARGEIVDHDVKGFTLSCDETIGSANDDMFIAGGTPVHGTITATLNGMTASLKVTTLEAEPSIKLKPTIVVDGRPYPIEVIAEVNGETYQYNPAMLGWTIDDSDVAVIKNGVLYAMNNGATHLQCQIGDMVDEADVSVEISEAPYIYEPWTEWSLKSSGHKNLSLSEDGTLSYTYGTSRVAFMSLNKAIRFFGLPDEVGFTFNSDVPVEKVLIDLRNYEYNKINGNESY